MCQLKYNNNSLRWNRQNRWNSLPVLRDLSFFLCVGEVNFEGGNRKKADLIKGRIKFGRNIVRGKEITNSSREGIRFLII